MLFVIDTDDPAAESYLKSGLPIVSFDPTGRRGMTDPVNRAVAEFWDTQEVIGFVGDDHRFRTSGWDVVFRDHLRQVGGGLAYGNDQNWVNGEIPTQIFGSAKIWKALGWMCLPTARHLYLDNTWRVIGDSLERLFYFPDVVIEHVHPAWGKAQWDDQYRQLNDPALYGADGEAFAKWLAEQAEHDVDRVRQAL
jgi:hypothetical protein